MLPERRIRVEVVYATPDAQEIVTVEVPAGASVKDVISQCGLGQRYPEIAATTVSVGIYGRSVPADTVLREGDRIEIYRPLLADPKHARRRRAASKS